MNVGRALLTISLAAWAGLARAATPENLVREMASKVNLPGVQNAFAMPIKARVDILTTGIRTPVGVKVLGTEDRKSVV